MPSGTFHHVEVASIHVKRDERQRRELTGIEDLAASLRDNGLINPILVQRDTLELVAGERRLSAARLLGWTHIPAQYEDEVEPHVLRTLELEENVRRVDLSWAERCTAIADYDALRRRADPSWTQKKTAESLNLDDADVSEKIAVASEIAKGNTVVAQAPKYSTALGIVRRTESRRVQAQTEALQGPRPSEAVLNVDFLEWATAYSGPPFNFLHCDFPYGINADKRHQGYSHEGLGAYSDTEDEYWALCATLARNLTKLCTESCHIMFWFSMRYYHETKEFFEANTDFALDPFPLIWTKSDNIGLLPDPERGPRRIYETAFFGSRGDRKIVRATSNSVALSSERDTHMSAKPQPMLEAFFKMFVDSSTSMLDPTCGSGSALRAAEALGAHRVLGLERDAEFASRAGARLEEQRNARV